MKDCSQKCFIEFQDCGNDYDCISCSISEEYWKTISGKIKHTKVENPNHKEIIATI